MCLFVVLPPNIAIAESPISDKTHLQLKQIERLAAEHQDLNLVDSKEIERTNKYARNLFKDKNYEAGYLVIDSLIPIAIEHNNALLVARVYETKARAKFKQRLYVEAEKYFLEGLKFTNEDSSDSIKASAELNHQIAMTYKRRNEHEIAVEFHKKALSLYSQINNTIGIARAYKNIANSEHKLGNLLSGLDNIIKGLELHALIDNDKGHAESLMLAGRIYRNLHRYEASLEQVKQAHELHKQMGNLGKYAFSSNQMGQLYSQLKKFDQARMFYQTSIELPVEKVSTKTRADAYRELGIIGLNTNSFESAKQHVNKAINLYKSIENLEKQAISTRILGEIFFAEGKLAEAQDTYNLALEYALNSKLNVDINVVKILNRLGRVLIVLNIEKANNAFSEALKIGREKNFKEEVTFALQGLVTVNRLKGDYLKALDYSTELNLASEKLYEKSDRELLAFAKSQLDSHKMEIEIELLREKVQIDKLLLEQKNNEIEISQQANTISSLEITKNRYAIILLLCLLVIFGCLGLYFNRMFAASKKENAELDKLATRDPLTNCFNRRALFDSLGQYFAKKEPKDSFSIIMVDIDRFKKINDDYGHDIGDIVICSVADTLKKCVRKDDIVARYGGEEYCVALKNTPQLRALDIAEKMRTKIENYKLKNLQFTCSFGVSSTDSGAQTPDRVISQADKALLNSKRTGRNKVTNYSNDISKEFVMDKVREDA